MTSSLQPSALDNLSLLPLNALVFIKWNSSRAVSYSYVIAMHLGNCFSLGVRSSPCGLLSIGSVSPSSSRPVLVFDLRLNSLGCERI